MRAACFDECVAATLWLRVRANAGSGGRCHAYSLVAACVSPAAATANATAAIVVRMEAILRCCARAGRIIIVECSLFD